MQYRSLGNSGIEASIVGLGTAAIGGSAQVTPDDRESVRAIHAALDAGVTLIDTAPSYGWGHSEEVVGEAIKDRRDQVVIASKCGLWWEDKRGSSNGIKDGKEVNISLRPDTITIEVENSLKRLGVDYIDLIQCHKQAIPPDETPVPETMGCLMDLKDQGKSAPSAYPTCRSINLMPTVKRGISRAISFATACSCVIVRQTSCPTAQSTTLRR